MKTGIRSIGLLCGVLAAAGAGVANAQRYPQKAIRFVVAFPAGGGVDVLARTVGNKLSEAWGVPIVVENRPGASGNIGTQLAARAVPDGYTILLGTAGNIAVSPSLYRKLPYDPVKDFAPVILLSAAPNLLAVHPSLTVKSVAELIKLAKARPGEINYASSGNGGPPHLAAELFKSMAKVDMLHVPYNGGPPSITAVVAGEASLTFGVMLNTIGPVKSGRLRPLAVTSQKRSPLLPDVPTIAEAGLKGYEAIAWYGFLAPSGTPASVLASLNAEISRILNDSDVKRRLSEEGAEILGGSPEQFAQYIQAELIKWRKVIQNAGISID